jgi:hypothetical protein
MHVLVGLPALLCPQVLYQEHLVLNGTHFNMQLPGGANLHKFPQRRQWPGLASPHQQPTQLNEGTHRPHITPGNLPTRTSSANGMRTANRTGSISVPPQVGQLLPNQYVMSPYMQHNSPSLRLFGGSLSLSCVLTPRFDLSLSLSVKSFVVHVLC